MTEERCDCWRIERPLDYDEPLPGHICFEAAVASVHSWAAEQAFRLASVIRDADLGLPGVEFGAARFSDDDRLILGRIFEDLDQLVDRAVTRWPLPVDELPVGIVIRQWAYEPPNQALANQLDDDSRWRPLIEEYRALYSMWLAQNKEREEEALHDWHAREGWSDNGAGIEGKDVRAARALLTHLKAVGLPSTPSVMKHLRAVAAGLDEPLPARGALVTTKIYVAVDPDGAVWPRQNADSTIDVTSTAIPMTVLSGPVQEVVKRHRAFLEHSERIFSYTDRRTIRRYQPGSFAQKYEGRERSIDLNDPRYDYVAEALRSADESVLDRRNGLPAINKHLEKVYHRVRKRRDDDGLPTEGPDGWREEARKQLRERQT